MRVANPPLVRLEEQEPAWYCLARSSWYEYCRTFSDCAARVAIAQIALLLIALLLFSM